MSMLNWYVATDPYDEDPKDKDSSWLGWLLVIVLILLVL